VNDARVLIADCLRLLPELEPGFRYEVREESAALVHLSSALLAWCCRAAPRIVLDGPDNPSELEAIAIAYDLVEKRARDSAVHLRTLGYLHMREKRWDAAADAFAQAARGDGEPGARLAIDRARLELVRGDRVAATQLVTAALATERASLATRDELRELLERAYIEDGRLDDALKVLDERAHERTEPGLELHHRLARELIARNDVGRAGAALERAVRNAQLLGRTSTVDERVDAAFTPIVAGLGAGGRGVDADALAARAAAILAAN
jgi:tetratricopeptide (TPR) repeat protein